MRSGREVKANADGREVRGQRAFQRSGAVDLTERVVRAAEILQRRDDVIGRLRSFPTGTGTREGEQAEGA